MILQISPVLQSEKRHTLPAILAFRRTNAHGTVYIPGIYAFLALGEAIVAD